MKEYNKEKLHEYAKELFELCLEKGLYFDYNSNYKIFQVLFNNTNWIDSSFSEHDFLNKGDSFMPIWELIEKVKQL